MRISDWSSDVCSSDLIDKRMLHARGYSDNGMFGADDEHPDPLGGSLLIKAKGFSVQGQLCGRRFWVAVFWRGELGDRVQIRGWESEGVREALARHEGDRFALTPEIGRASCRERVCQYV